MSRAPPNAHRHQHAQVLDTNRVRSGTLMRAHRRRQPACANPLGEVEAAAAFAAFPHVARDRVIVRCDYSNGARGSRDGYTRRAATEAARNSRPSQGRRDQHEEVVEDPQRQEVAIYRGGAMWTSGARPGALVYAAADMLERAGHGRSAGLGTSGPFTTDLCGLKIRCRNGVRVQVPPRYSLTCRCTKRLGHR
jgi:hypothetical protein